MKNEKNTIAIDAMGGDNSPFKNLKGVEIFLKNVDDVKILLFGNKDILISCLNENSIVLKNFEIIDTKDNIKDSDTVNTILRKRKNSRRKNEEEI